MQRAMFGIEPCDGCPLRGSKQVLLYKFGESPTLLFIGEAPGKDEERQGVPFIGKSGQELRKALREKGFVMEDIAFANTVRCRPVDEENANRPPTTQEKKHCRPFLEEDIDTISPTLIVALGKTAKDALLKKGEEAFRGIPVASLLHPAAMLYDRGWQPIFNEQVQKLKDRIDRYATNQE